MVLQTAKYLDEQIHREYAKIGQRLEKRNIRPEVVGLGGCFVSALSLPLASSLEAYINLQRLLTKNVTSGTLATNFITTVGDSWGRFIRLPCMALSTFFLGYGGYRFLEGISSENLSHYNDAAISLFYSVCWLGLSSSMYLRDKNPSLLDKKSILDSVGDYLKEKLSSEPLPQPAELTD